MNFFKLFKWKTNFITIFLGTLPLLLPAQSNMPYKNIELPLEERVEDLLNRLTLTEKVNLLWETAPPIERLDIPKYYHGNEALHGIVRPGKFTVFPQAIALASTWNPDLMHVVATAISDEARGRWTELEHGKQQKAKYSDLLAFWSPTVNMARDPRWGRTAETYGEDPYLTSKMGVAFVKGLQGDDPQYLKVVSTPKHYVANNVEENRFGANSVISERAMREYYLPAFRACIEEGKAHSIMSAYNSINWVPSTANRWLLHDLLREEWGFDGYVVSDCGAVSHLWETHKLTKTPAEAAAASIKAGMDLECSGYCGECQTIHGYLEEAHKQGLITMEEIDLAASRVLRARFRLGLFDPIDANPYNAISPEVVGSPKHQALALETARQSIVLLKNQNDLLPLNPQKRQTIALIGHNADQTIFGDYSGEPLNKAISPLEGIQTLLKGNRRVKILHVPTKMKSHNMQLIDEEHLKTPDGKPGLLGYYFNVPDLSGTPKTRIDAKVDIHSTENKPDPLFGTGNKSVRWEGSLNPTESGEYEIGISGDDGVRFWLDGELLIDQWINRVEKLDKIKIKLEKGKSYSLKLEYYDGGGGFACRLWWLPTNFKGDAASKVFAKEIEAAKKSDKVIAVIGTGLYNEREGHDKTSLDLPGNQIEMLKAVTKVNPNVIVVLVTGSQHTISWIQEKIPAILNVWYPGEQGGNALAEVVFGKHNPSARLPITYYEDLTKLPHMDRYEINEGRTYMYYQGEPIYSFGYGLSYTDFSYAQLAVDKEKYQLSDSIRVSFQLQNTGDMEGAEIAQAYVSYPSSKMGRPLKQLRDFQRVALAKGETKEVTFSIAVSDLTYWSEDKKDWEIEEGEVELLIGAASDDIRLKKRINIMK